MEAGEARDALLERAATLVLSDVAARAAIKDLYDLPIEPGAVFLAGRLEVALMPLSKAGSKKTSEPQTTLRVDAGNLLRLTP